MSVSRQGVCAHGCAWTLEHGDLTLGPGNLFAEDVAALRDELGSELFANFKSIALF
jgi:hypothetical protein